MKYVLKDLVTNKVLAIDDKPHFLNYLRLGLPDCELDIDESAVVDPSMITKRLELMNYINQRIQQIQSTTFLMPPFCESNPFDCSNEFITQYAKEIGVDFDTLKKRYDLVFENQRLFLIRCTLVFEKYLDQILKSHTSTELDTIKNEFDAVLRHSSVNS